MPTYSFRGCGRRVGAIGITHGIVEEGIEAASPREALLRVYETFDHVSQPVIEDLITGHAWVGFDAIFDTSTEEAWREDRDAWVDKYNTVVNDAIEEERRLRHLLGDKEAEIADLRERYAFRERERDEARAQLAEVERRLKEATWIIERSEWSPENAKVDLSAPGWAEIEDEYDARRNEFLPAVEAPR